MRSSPTSQTAQRLNTPSVLNSQPPAPRQPVETVCLDLDYFSADFVNSCSFCGDMEKHKRDASTSRSNIFAYSVEKVQLLQPGSAHHVPQRKNSADPSGASSPWGSHQWFEQLLDGFPWSYCVIIFARWITWWKPGSIVIRSKLGVVIWKCSKILNIITA